MKLIFIQPVKLIISISFLVIGITSSIGADKKEVYKRGLNAQAEENHEKAVEYFKKSLKEEGETPECLANLGLSLSYISKGYVNEAYICYKKALQINSNHEETLGYLGELHILQGNLIKANEILQQLIKLESNEAETLKEKLDKIIGQLNEIKKAHK